MFTTFSRFASSQAAHPPTPRSNHPQARAETIEQPPPPDCINNSETRDPVPPLAMRASNHEASKCNSDSTLDTT
ncbi:hypothetical protein Nepgr_023935 [Nepenthes gracilis]|uniref:Uncharacterized protein n=1 Tax=Nepenthes gracilis TaxID=150966 RepID=A0AAD3XY53_NEPGR|nr:hypothetical protein Nepgr_023935 [Nepenthes gracilis]